MTGEEDQRRERRESGVESGEAGVEGGVSGEDGGGGGGAWGGGLREGRSESTVGSEGSGGGCSGRVDAGKVRRVPAEDCVAR